MRGAENTSLGPFPDTIAVTLPRFWEDVCRVDTPLPTFSFRFPRWAPAVLERRHKFDLASSTVQPVPLLDFAIHAA